jgi:asparagine N-glycosylation enzyme membrane subunit Stt3
VYILDLLIHLEEDKMKIILYLCAGVSVLIGLYELTWIGRSSLAIIIIFLAFIVAINSYVLARKEK